MASGVTSGKGQDLRDLNIGIAGLGLIGGSIAMALKEKVGIHHIAGLNRTPGATEEALAGGWIDKAGVLGRENDERECLSDCDIIFLCTPVDVIPSLAARLAVYNHGILTDAGSTKAGIMATAEQQGISRFIGGHPMAGSERTGFRAARPDLLERAVYVLCPQAGTTPEDLSLVKTVVSAMGAVPIILSSVEHDRAVGLVSHLPHAAAACLVNTVGDRDGTGMLRRMAAGGFKDITRIASASPSLWTAISLGAGSVLEEILGEYIRRLEAFRTALDQKDEDGLRRIFEMARNYREAIPGAETGMTDEHEQEGSP